MAAIGWYGPLIDLSRAASHIGDYVQLLVFVHRSAPVQYKLSRGVEVIRTDIQVGDDTRSFFSVSIWQKEMGSMTLAGGIVLLQNVRITRFHEVVEARTVQCSSLQCLVPPDKLIVSTGVDDIMTACQVGVRMKEKLRKVIEWVKLAKSSFDNVALHRYQHTINWRVHEERVSQDCFSLLEVLRLTDSGKATFLASIGELFLPLNSKCLSVCEERMFISRRICIMGDKYLAEDLICSGCQLCGSALDSQSRSASDLSTLSLYCQGSSNHLHKISTIYRPFMLYVFDDSNCIPLLVKNKAAEVLFGNIQAERVYSCYKGQNLGRTPNIKMGQDGGHSYSQRATQPNVAERGLTCSVSADTQNNSSGRRENQQSGALNFYAIWLVLIKVLVQQGTNSPLKFKVKVNSDRDMESGRFELVSLSMPCFRTKG